jgi:hypothetical protein
MKRVGGRDEEYESPTRAAFSWIVLWWWKQVTAHGALAWGRAGMKDSLLRKDSRQCMSGFQLRSFDFFCRHGCVGNLKIGNLDGTRG